MRMLPRARFRAPLLALLAITTTLGLTASPAQAATVNYIALGDSYSSGLGAGGYYLLSGTCYVNDYTYPVLWKNSHSVSSFKLKACASATTSTVTSSQLGNLSSSTTLVTITVGGNDVGFVNVVATCKATTSSSLCDSAVDSAEASATGSTATALSTLYATIKSKAPNAKLVVLSYPRLFETGSSCGTFSMTQANRIRLNEGADVLNSVIKARAEAAGATYVDVNPYFEGHRVCASTPYINGLVATIVESYHPNKSGYSKGYLPALVSAIG